MNNDTLPVDEKGNTGRIDTTKLVITAASTVVVGAAAGAYTHLRPVAPDTSIDDDEEELEDIDNVVDDDNTTTDDNTTNNNVANNRTADNSNSHTPAKPHVDKPDHELTPTEKEASQWNIDEDDVDAADIIKIDKMMTHYDTEGNEHEVAVGHFPTGDKFMLADIDEDDIYESFYDLNGNPIELAIDGKFYSHDALADVAKASGLSHSDLVETIGSGIDDPEGDYTYLAPEEHEIAYVNEDDIKDDIISEELVAEDVITDDDINEDAIGDDIIDDDLAATIHTDDSATYHDTDDVPADDGVEITDDYDDLA